MTLKEITNQLRPLLRKSYNLRTKKDVSYFIKMKLMNRNIFQVVVNFPDGDWLAYITKGDYGYDLIIPDNREQEYELLLKYFNYDRLLKDLGVIKYEK